jgi:hypothetical protein
MEVRTELSQKQKKKVQDIWKKNTEKDLWPYMWKWCLEN